MKTLRLKKIEIAAAVFVILFSIGLRVNAPNADLPSHLTFSGSILTDEGNQCHNSRSKALFGEWFPDDWRITNYNPVLPWIKYAIFKIFGVGLWQVRLVNYIFAALSILFFFFTLKSYFREKFKFALLGTLLLGINFLYVMYNKIGTFETSIIFWMILTMYFLEKFRSERNGIFLFLAGASTSMTFIFKTITAYVFPIPFIAYILMLLFNPAKDITERIPLRQAGKHILFIILGIFALLIPWYFFHYLPNKEWIISSPGQFMGNLIFPKSLKMAFNNFLAFPWREQFYKIPVVWLGSVLYIPLFYRRLLRKETRLTEIGYTFFFFAHTAVFFIMTYRPTRYFIPVIPAMVFMTAMLLERWAAIPSSKGNTHQYPRFIKISIIIVDTVWLSLAAYFCLIPLANRYIFRIHRPDLSIYYFMVSLILVIAVYQLKSFYRKMVWNNLKLKYPLYVLTAILVIISLTINMGYYLNWYDNRAYNIYNMSQEWNKKLDNAYIAGMTAAASVLGTPFKTLWLYPNFVNWDEHTFDRYPVTHALLGADISVEILHYFNQWPERMSHTQLSKVYHIKNYFLHFYSFVDPYVKGGTASGEGFHLEIVNPGKEELKCKVGRIYFFKTSPEEKTAETPFKIFPGKDEYTIKPEENRVEFISGDVPRREAEGVLFYLDYSLPYAGETLRYEGEIFARRTGSNRKISTASDKFVRYFNPEKDAPGFLAYGPKVPYARGFLIADFNLEFSGLKTALLPLCRIEIFAPLEKAVLAEKIIRPKNTRENPTHTYRLHTLLPHTRTLEFRIEAEKKANIAFDYLDLTYYQGYYLELSPNSI